MKKQEFNRVAADNSQLQKFVDKAIDSMTTLYSHHFALVVENDPYLGINYSIAFNVISNNPTPYEKLSDLEGDGYIMSAFGMTETDVFEARLVYQGDVFMYRCSLNDGTMMGHILPGYGDFPLQDSVTKI